MVDASSFRSGGYRPSGKCDWFKLLAVSVPLCLLGACLLAFILCKVFLWGIYLLFIVPMFAGLLLGCEAAFMFRFAHCRNPHVAAGLGALLASVMFLGYFHCYHVAMRGPGVLTRIDALPAVINFRMHTDVTHSTHEVGNQKKEPNVYENWIFFAVDWAAAAAACGIVAFLGARRAYCETCSRWMLTKKATVAAGSAGKVIAAVAARQIASLPELPAVRAKSGAAVAKFELEYCPGNKDQADICPIYLTATEITSGKNKNVVVARQISLNVEELAQLATKVGFQ